MEPTLHPEQCAVHRESWTRARTVLAVLAVLTACTAVLVLPSVAAAAGDPALRATIVVRADGAAPFDANDLAGNDSGATNGRTRNADVWRLALKWEVRSATARDLTLVASTTTGAGWLDVPAVCIDDDAHSSGISSDGRTLTCALGNRRQGSTGVVQVEATPTSARNGAQVQASVRARASGSIVSATSPSVSTIASSRPLVDLRSNDTPVSIDMIEVPGTGEVGSVTAWPISVDVGGTGRGAEALTGAVSFTANVGGAGGISPNSRLFAPPGFVDTPCGPLGARMGNATPFGTEVPGVSNDDNRTRHSGDWTCVTQPDGTVTITVDGVDWGSNQFPTMSSTYSSLGSRRVLIAGYISVFTPLADIQALIGAPDGQTTLTMTTDSFVATGVSGLPNGGEDAGNNSSSVVVDTYEPGTFLSEYRAEYSEFGFKHPGSGITMFWPEVRPRILDPAAGMYVPTQSENDYAGDGLVYSGQHVAYSFKHGRFDGGLGDPLHNRISCLKFDPAAIRLVNAPPWRRKLIQADIEQAGFATTVSTQVLAGPGSPVRVQRWFSSHEVITENFGIPYGNPLPTVAGTHFVVEYGVGSMLTTQQLGQRQCDDADADVQGWTSDPASIAGGLAAVNMLRIRHLADIGDHETVSVFVSLQVQPGPVGGYVPVWAGFGEDPPGSPDDGTRAHWFVQGGDPITPWYDPAVHAWDTQNLGDRFTRTEAALSVELASDRALATPYTAGEVLVPGDQIEWTITASSVAASGSTGSVPDVDVSAIIPAGLRYAGTPAGSPEPTSVVPNGAGPGTTVASWHVGDLSHNARLPFRYITAVRESAADSTFINVAAIDGTLAQPQAAGLTAAAFGVVAAPASTMEVGLTGSSLVSVNGDYRLDVEYENVGGTDREDVQMLVVLPGEAGSLPRSSFHGTSRLRAVETRRGEKVEYTDVEPARLSRDPSAPLPGGRAWCVEGDLGTAGCPESTGAATAVRLTRSTLAVASGRQLVRLILGTRGNRRGDRYAARVELGGGELLGTVSNDWAVRVPDPEVDIDVFVRHQLTNGRWIQADASDGLRGRYSWGDRPSYRVVVRNRGNLPLEHVRVRDPFVAACSRTLGRIAPGRSRTYTCTIGVHITAGYTNTATVSARVGASVCDDAPDLAGCRSAITRSDVARVLVDGVSSIGGPNLSISRGGSTSGGGGAPTIARLSVVNQPLVGRRPLAAGQRLAYRVAVRNTSRRPAYNVRLCDRIRSGASFIAAPSGDWAAGRVCWYFNVLAPGATRNVSVLVRVSRSARRGDRITTVVTGRASNASRATGSLLERESSRAVVRGVAVGDVGGVTG